MTDKYYTPELEEAHIGFECELNIKPTEEVDEWIYYKIDSYLKLRNIYESPKVDIRVKYLDKQDIEDCGFEHVASTNFDDFYRHIKTKIGLFAPKSASTFINIVIAEDFLIKHIDIKNINELRKLLKQLGI